MANVEPELSENEQPNENTSKKLEDQKEKEVENHFPDTQNKVLHIKKMRK